MYLIEFHIREWWELSAQEGGWPLISSVNMLIGYCTYTAASHTHTQEREHRLHETRSHIYHRAPQSYASQESPHKICRRAFFSDSEASAPDWDELSVLGWHVWDTAATSAIRNNKTVISAIAKRYFGISWISFRAVCSFLVSFRSPLKGSHESSADLTPYEHSDLEG